MSAPSLLVGWPAPPGISFSPVSAILKFPYKHVPLYLKQPCADEFFVGGRLWAQGWDVFYAHNMTPRGPKTIFFFDSAKVAESFNRMNAFFNSDGVIGFGKDAKDIGLIIDFDDHTEPIPRPRFFGHIASVKRWQTAQCNAPPSQYLPELRRLTNDAHQTPIYSHGALQVFVDKLELAAIAGSKNNKAARDRKKAERLIKQAEYGRQVRRCQRYLGIRHGSVKSQLTTDIHIPPTFVPDMQVIFVCIDVEAWEKNNNIITEVGIAILDTDDLREIAPGDNAQEWRSLIKSRHLRIQEHVHFENTQYVRGCAAGYNFGESELISQNEIAKVLSECFAPPFGKSANEGGLNDTPRRVVFVGHDAGADITYLRRIGFDLPTQACLLEVLDTALMFRSHKREFNNRALGTILSEFAITSWNLHNAGNDAVYTLQAMLALAIHASISPYAGIRRAEEKQMIMEELLQDGIDRIIDEEEGWDLPDHDNGGAPVPWPVLDLTAVGRPKSKSVTTVTTESVKESGDQSSLAIVCGKLKIPTGPKNQFTHKNQPGHQKEQGPTFSPPSGKPIVNLPGPDNYPKHGQDSLPFRSGPELPTSGYQAWKNSGYKLDEWQNLPPRSASSQEPHVVQVWPIKTTPQQPDSLAFDWTTVDSPHQPSNPARPSTPQNRHARLDSQTPSSDLIDLSSPALAHVALNSIRPQKHTRQSSYQSSWSILASNLMSPLKPQPAVPHRDREVRAVDEGRSYPLSREFGPPRDATEPSHIQQMLEGSAPSTPPSLSHSPDPEPERTTHEEGAVADPVKVMTAQEFKTATDRVRRRGKGRRDNTTTNDVFSDAVANGDSEGAAWW
ncbi:MAG: hypothetical protein M1814_003292 [Vezdaea aestivalis]|nr:MAG: hypothetical protein M1814_003292 [Vezdaea aestivalis]